MSEGLQYTDLWLSSGEKTMQPIDLEKLPAFAQSELQDFYQFLMQKYAPQVTRGETVGVPLAPRLVKPFKPLSREAIYER
jgi:hypothetical protein